MPPSVREVIVQRTTQLSEYRFVEGLADQVVQLREKGRSVAGLIGAQRLWMLNSTATGGGVAEMMPRLCDLLSDLGIDAHWLVLDPDDPAFFPITKGLHNLLHGEPAPAPPGAREIYERVSRAAAQSLRERLASGDVLVVHDPQPLGATAFLPAECRPRLLWRCHIGLPFRNDATRAGWDFLRPYLAPFERLLFSAESYIPDEHRAKSDVLYPGIDPLSHKNRELRPYKLWGVLRSAGLAEGPPVPEWARFTVRAQRFAAGRWQESPVPSLLDHPAIVQISRFDRLKGFEHLIPAFELLLRDGPSQAQRLRVDTARALSELERVQLVLAGPEPAGVSDDPECGAVLEELCRQHAALPPALAARVHLLCLPLADLKENALAVNALQRAAAVVVQNSLKEGFGLTVSEALWKGTPVVASNAGGLGIQVRHGTDGWLVDAPTDAAAVASGLLHALCYPREAEAMACAGRARVREHFLITAQLLGWLTQLERLLARPRASD